MHFSLTPTDSFSEEEDEFIMAEDENNHEDDMRNLHIDGKNNAALLQNAFGFKFYFILFFFTFSELNQTMKDSQMPKRIEHIGTRCFHSTNSESQFPSRKQEILNSKLKWVTDHHAIIIK